MLKLVKSLRAESDLVDIWLYIAEDQPLNANRFLDKLNNAIESLVESPAMGVDRPELGDSVKSFPIGNYAVFYRVSDVELEVVRVLSSFQDIDSSLF